MYKDTNQTVTLGIVKRKLTGDDIFRHHYCSYLYLGHASKVGGRPVWHDSSFASEPNPMCPSCKAPLQLIFTLNADILEPTHLLRSLYFFACLKTTCCCKSINWKVIRNQTPYVNKVHASSSITNELLPSISNHSPSRWDFLNTSPDSSICGLDDPFDLNNLEALLAKRDEKIGSTDIKVKPSSKSSRRNVVGADNAWLVEDEPEEWYGDDKPNDVYDENHVRERLQAYLNDEEDTGLKQLIESAVLSTGSHNERLASTIFETDVDDADDAAAEGRYARLDPASSAEFEFQQRLALQPKQVLRYAYGGEPLWCTAPPPIKCVDVPPCEKCGGMRIFECQLMPAICSYFPSTHQSESSESIKTDSLKIGSTSEVDTRAMMSNLRNAVGFHFGVVALWSCEKSCSDGLEEFVIVQSAPGDF